MGLGGCYSIAKCFMVIVNCIIFVSAFYLEAMLHVYLFQLSLSHITKQPEIQLAVNHLQATDKKLNSFNYDTTNT